MSLYSEDYDRLSKAINNLEVYDLKCIENTFIDGDIVENNCNSSDIVLKYRGVVTETVYSNSRKYRYSNIGRGESYLVGKSPESLATLLPYNHCSVGIINADELVDDRALYVIQYSTNVFEWGQVTDRDIFMGTYDDCKYYIISMLKLVYPSAIKEVEYSRQLLELEFSNSGYRSRVILNKLDTNIGDTYYTSIFIHTTKGNYKILEVTNIELSNKCTIQSMLTQFLGEVVLITLEGVSNINYIIIKSYRELFESICERSKL